MHWFDRPELVSQFPFPYRVLARYCRLAVHRSTGTVRGGSFLQRAIIRLSSTLRLESSAHIQLKNASAYLDLRDPRIWFVMDEVEGESSDHAVMRAFLSPGDTFVDIGANQGGFSIFASGVVDARGLVVAVEPQPRFAWLIERSLQANDASPWQVHSFACGDVEGNQTLYIPRWTSGSASVFSGYVDGRVAAITVPTKLLDRAVKWEEFPGEVFLKIDVEGSELAFVRGARRMIAARHPVILFEMNPTSARAAGWEPRELLMELGSLGYDRACPVDEFGAWRALEDIDPHRQQNIVTVSAERRVPETTGS